MSKIKLDDIDHQILDMLIENTRTPFTDIAKKLLISAGTVHVRVKKMEDYGLIKGSSLILDYDTLGYTFIAYVGLYINFTRNPYPYIWSYYVPSIAVVGIQSFAFIIPPKAIPGRTSLLIITILLQMDVFKDVHVRFICISLVPNC